MLGTGAPRRVCVLGCPGAGKSTLSDRLGRLLDLPVVHLDHHHWLPGWVRLDNDAWRARVAEFAAGERWLLDGNYAGTLDLRLPRADLVVLVDPPRPVCLGRTLRRWARYRGRPYTVPHCPEQIDWPFLRYIWRWPREGRPRTLSLVERYAPPGSFVLLTTGRQTEQWLRSLTETPR